LEAKKENDVGYKVQKGARGAATNLTLAWLGKVSANTLIGRNPIKWAA
jgi:hypothetical protein